MVFKTKRVSDLWENRLALANPRKKKRLRRFYDVLEPLARMWDKGQTLNDQDAMQTDYFHYLRKYRPRWMKEPLDEQIKQEILAKWRDTENLFYDIKQRGMLDPIEMVVDPGDVRYIRRGNRRLVCLHVLGIKTADVCYAEYAEWESR